MQKNKYKNRQLKYRKLGNYRTQKTLIELFCNDETISGFQDFILFPIYKFLCGSMFWKYNKVAKCPKALIQNNKMFKMFKS